MGQPAYKWLSEVFLMQDPLIIPGSGASSPGR